MRNQGKESLTLKKHASEFRVILNRTANDLNCVGNHSAVKTTTFDMNVIAESPDDESGLGTVCDTKRVWTEHIDLEFTGSGRPI